MITLGINSNHADSSACLFVNNKLEFGIEEERINRIKHWSGLPIKSIKECLDYANIELENIDHLTINTNPKSNLTKKIPFFLKNFLFGEKKYEILKRVRNKINLKSDIQSELKLKFKKNLEIKYIDHHLSHLSSAFYPSGFDKAVGVSVDGFGDFCSIMIAKCDFKKIKIVKKIFFPNSLGVLYEAFTQFIGFLKYGEEYKMMGLSCYGNPIYFDLIKKKLFNNYYNNQLNLKYFNHINKNFTYNFEGEPNQKMIFNNNVYELCNDFKNLTDETKKNIAASIQKIFEDKLMSILQYCKKIDFSENLVYAGGCALNSLANKEIYSSNLFKKIYIPYAPGDGGGCIGSALYFLKDKFDKFENLHSPYIGKGYNKIEIESFFKKNKVSSDFNLKTYNDKNKLYEKVAGLISENKVVGFFNNRMEFGARALGNRSILANPCNPDMKNILNIKIKRRENFRPFAPSILLECKREWFGNDRENPYMSNVEIIVPDKRKKIPAVTHFDGTGRVQTVSKVDNPDYHLLIENFNKITGVPILLNT